MSFLTALLSFRAAPGGVESFPCHSERSEESLCEAKTSGTRHPTPSIPVIPSLRGISLRSKNIQHPSPRTQHPTPLSFRAKRGISLRSKNIQHPASHIQHLKKPTLSHLRPFPLHLYNWNKQPIFNVPVLKCYYSCTQALAKGFGVLKGDRIVEILCGIGLHKTLPSHSSEERWRSFIS